MINVSHLDHWVLTVKDIDTTVAFYENLLGMKKTLFGEQRVALSFGHQKINLHQAGHEFKPKAACAKPGTVDLCFIITTPLEEAITYCRTQGVHILDDPFPTIVQRMGAKGPIRSIYVRDPDNNLLELSNYI